VVVDFGRRGIAMALQRKGLRHRDLTCDVRYVGYRRPASTNAPIRLVLHRSDGVEVHKMCVICVTVGGPDKRTDVTDKHRIDLGSQLAERL
jgi:hypothetical protein